AAAHMGSSRLSLHDALPIWECWILAPELHKAIQQPLAAFGSSAYVYSPYVLCRSLEVWQSLTRLTLPEAIRPLIESTYAIRVEADRKSTRLNSSHVKSSYAV